jgi:SAM-dependent methyltransferase
MKPSYEAHEVEWRKMEAAGIKSWFCKSHPWEIDPHDEHFLEDVFAQPWAPKDGAALELGCGTGPLTRWLGGRGFNSTGIDISRTAIRMARAQSKKLKTTYRVADICTQPIAPPETIDLCVDGRFFHGIVTPNDRQAVLVKVHRLLKRKGVFVLMSMCSPIERTILARQYPEQRILQNVIYYPCQHGEEYSDSKAIEGMKYFPARFLGHWKMILSELQRAGFRPSLVRFNRCLPEEPVSSLNVAAIKL